MRLLILLASIAFASCGVLQNDITGDLRPPSPAQQETSGYATTAGLGASADAAIGTAGAEEGRWVGVQEQQQQLQQYQHQQQQHQQQEVAASLSGQDNQGLLASYQPSAQQVAQIPQYQNSALGGQGAQYQSPGVSLATGAAPQQVPASGTGHKYTSVSFGNGLVGLGHTVDYNAIGQKQNENNQNYLASQAVPDVTETHANSVPGSGFGAGVALPSAQYGAPSGSAYDTISVSENIQTIPIEVPQAYQVTHSRPVHVPVAIPTPVEIPRPVPVEVSQPVPVHVERPYPVYVKVPVSVEKPVPVPVPVKVPHKVEIPEYHQHLAFLHHDADHNKHHHHHAFDAHSFHHHQHQQLPHVSFNEHSFHKGHAHFKPIAPHYAPHSHHEHHEAPHYHGSNHHSSSILAGLTGGLSSKLRGGHGGGAPHYPGGGHGAAASFGGDHKFANGLDAHLQHSYHSDAGYKFGHGFSGSLGFASNSHSNLGYASGYSGKYLADYPRHSFASSGYEKRPAFSTGKYSGLAGFAGYHSYKVPETINQQYDANGGYKY